MLNEIKEFEQYTYSLDTEKADIRLKHKTLCNELSGTARAMTIIARRLYFKDECLGRIDRVKDNLKAWCGDLKVKNPENIDSEIKQGWLPEYIVSVLGAKKLLEFENYLMTEGDINSLPKYQEICDMVKEIHENYNIDAFREKENRERTTDFAKRIYLFSKELGSSESQRKKSSAMYAPVYHILNALNMLNGRYGARGYNQKMFNDKLDRPDKNDFKKIMYEKIIADAIAEGPLARYYLVCEKDEFSNIKYVTVSKNNRTKEVTRKESFPFRKRKGTEIAWSEPTKKKADLIMKVIAAILLEQKARNAAELYEGVVPVNKTDIANWLAGSTGTDSLKQFFVDGHALFRFEDIDNVAAVGVDSEWMTLCGWKVIPENELDTYLSEHRGAVFFSDPGAGVFLKKNVRYA